MDTGPNPSRNLIVVLVDDLDLAVRRTLRCARPLRPNTLYPVHFAVDNVHADRLVRRWHTIQHSDVPLQLPACPDRRIARAAQEMIAELAAERTQVTAVPPRRAYGLSRYLLHTHNADRTGAAVSSCRAARSTTAVDGPGAVLQPHPLPRHHARRSIRVRGAVGRYQGEAAIANPK